MLITIVADCLASTVTVMFTTLPLSRHEQSCVAADAATGVTYRYFNSTPYYHACQHVTANLTTVTTVTAICQRPVCPIQLDKSFKVRGQR